MELHWGWLSGFDLARLKVAVGLDDGLGVGAGVGLNEGFVVGMVVELGVRAAV